MRAAPVEVILKEETFRASLSSNSRINAHWVGTPWATLTRSSTIERNALLALQGVGVMIVVTPLEISSHTLVMYPMWANGRGESLRSPR